MVPIMSLFDTSFLIWSVRLHEKIMTSLASFVSHLGEKCVLRLLRLVKRAPSLTCDTLFTWSALFPFVPILCTWKGLIFPAVGFWMRGCGRLWCCYREGHAPHLSECVMQQPLPWKTKKMFQVDVWKGHLSFVLSVGGGWWRWWLVTFAFRNISWTRPVWILHKSVLFWFFSIYWCRFLKTQGWHFANLSFYFSAIDWFHRVFSLKPFSPRILFRTFHSSWSFRCSCKHQMPVFWPVRHQYDRMNTSAHEHIYNPPPPFQHLDLPSVCVYSLVHWLHAPFPCFLRIFHFRHCTSHQYIQNTQLGKADRCRIFLPPRLYIQYSKGQLCFGTSGLVSLCTAVTRFCGVTLTGLLLPPRRTLAVWWSPWTPTGPCLSTHQTKWRSIATGTSTSSVHTCESTSHMLSTHPPTHLVLMWILCLPAASATYSLTVWCWMYCHCAISKALFSSHNLCLLVCFYLYSSVKGTVYCKPL